MKSVSIFTKYDYLSASVRERIYPYVEFLKQNGYNVQYYPLIEDKYFNKHIIEKKIKLLFIIKIFFNRIYNLALCKKNIIIIQYELIPFFPPILEKILSFFKIKYILDIDDAIFLRYENKKNLLINFFLSLKFETLFNNASCVIAGNKYLAHKAKSMGQKNTQIIPTCVSLPDKKLKKKKKILLLFGLVLLLLQSILIFLKILFEYLQRSIMFFLELLVQKILKSKKTKILNF